MSNDANKLAERLFQLRASATEIRKALKEIQDATDQAAVALMDELSKLPEAQRTVRVPAGSITAVWKSRPEVATLADLHEFHKHILATQDFTLLQNRLSEANIRKVWETGDSVPGVTRIDTLELSYSAAKAAKV